MEGFHDQEALQALTEQVIDALRPLGISADTQTIQYGIQEGQMMVMIMGVVRPQARQRAQQDMETAAEFNQMMAEQNRIKQEEEKKKIAGLSQSPEDLEKWLFDNESECQHENVVEGLCLDCQEEVDAD